MTRRSDNWFRRVGEVTLTKEDGSQVGGWGTVLPWNEKEADLWGEIGRASCRERV